MNRELLDHWCERAILILVSAVLIFGPLALGGVRASEFVVLHWLILTALVIWLVRLWATPKFRFLLPPAAWAVLPFVVYAIWRYRTADIEYVARQEFIQVALAAVFLLVIVNNLYGQTELRFIVVCVVAVGTFAAMYGIYQWLTRSDYVWHFLRPGYHGRGSGTYICPNHLAGFLEMACPLAIAFTVLRGFGVVARILFAYASFVMLVGVAATGSRAGWLSMSVAIVLMVAILIQKKTYVWIALALLIAVGSIGAWMYSRTLASRMEQNSSNHPQDDIRFEIWKSARAMWKDNPWIGVGPDHFDFRYRGYRRAFWAVQPRPGRAHNDYWNTLADWGIIGLILVLLPVAVTGIGIVLSWKNLHRTGDSAGTRTALVLGSLLGLTAILVHSFFDFNMHIPANEFLAATLIGIITTHWRFASQRFWITARWPIRIAATLVLSGAAFYLGGQAVQRTRQDLALRLAQQKGFASKEGTAALEKAFRIEPKNSETALAIGEVLRLRSWNGGDDYKTLALEALPWFQRAMELNRWDPQPYIRTGMCLDWIGRHAEAKIYFDKALQVDPNHWFTRGMMGWHYFQIENFAEARRWMEKSVEAELNANTFAYTYLEILRKKLSQSTNDAALLR